MARPTTNDAAVAERLVQAMTSHLAAGRTQDVTVRAIAAQAGASTTAIYSLFGGRDGLVGAALRQAAEDLRCALVAVAPGEDPLHDLSRLGQAYLQWADTNPGLYNVLFSGAAGFSPEDRAPAGDLAEPLMLAIDRAVRAGHLDGAPAMIATTLWAGLHGLASLTCTGALPAAAASRAARPMIDSLIRGWTPHEAPPPA